MSEIPIESQNNINSKNSKSNSNLAIPFITYNESSKKFIINKDAKKILSNPSNKKIGIISLVGKYRTGKSFLLNKVIINNNESNTDGFAVGPTIKPCTKGIWLWSKPLIINGDSNVEQFPTYLIDTEGLGAYDEDINHDSKIFLIAILISSLFIYNSIGTIDENALSNLSFILNLSKSLKLKNNEDININSISDINTDNEFAKYFPILFWVLRDFSLKLEDSEGNAINSNQYLENSLMEQEGTSEVIIEKNLIRKKIKNYFLERYCFPLVRPVENEKDLQNLMNLPDNKIRPEFLLQSNNLKNNIFSKIKPKNFGGNILSGEMLIALLESIINSINNGAIPVIENSWKYITDNECIKNTKIFVEKYREKIIKFQKEKIEKENFFEELNKYNENINKEIINEFNNTCLEMQFEENDIKKYDEILKNNLKQEYKKLTQENINLLKDKYNFELNKEIDNLFQNKEKILNMNYISFINELIQIKYKLDSSIPDFFLKQQISFEKIIEVIKKYIEEFFVKNKNSVEQKINNLISQKNFLEEKNKKILDEYTKDKNDFKNTVNKYNDMLIENKLKMKTMEEKIKNFEEEKRILKETYIINSEEKNKELNDLNNKLSLEINKLKIELKTKEEEILLINLNKEQDLALSVQKINFLENEINEWKKRYNSENKELSEIKTEKIHLIANIDKLKVEIKNLKNKINSYEINNENNPDKNMNMTITGKGFYSSNSIGGRGTSKVLVELMTGQNSIKDFLEEIKNNTEKILDMNKNILNNIQQGNTNKQSKNENEEIINNKTNKNNFNTDKKIKKNDMNDNIHNLFFSNDKNKNSEIIINKSNINKKLNYSNSKENREKNLSYKIRIINHTLKKNNSGKPYIDYICEVKFKEKTNKLHRKLINFYSLHKSLTEFFKDKINIPDKDNIFKEENIKNSLMENKQELLNNYIEEISKINDIKKSIIFQNFFEINN